LMIGEMPSYTFKGFMFREDLKKENKLGDLWHGMSYLAEQNELKELHDLYELDNIINTYPEYKKIPVLKN
jgi:hypothetical protein